MEQTPVILVRCVLTLMVVTTVHVLLGIPVMLIKDALTLTNVPQQMIAMCLLLVPILLVVTRVHVTVVGKAMEKHVQISMSVLEQTAVTPMLYVPIQPVVIHAHVTVALLAMGQHVLMSTNAAGPIIVAHWLHVQIHPVVTHVFAMKDTREMELHAPM